MGNAVFASTANWSFVPAWQMHLQFGLFPFQPVVYDWSIKGMCYPVCGKVHIKDPLLVIGKRSLCGDSGFPLKKFVTMTIWLTSNSGWYENQSALEASLNKTNFLSHHNRLCLPPVCLIYHGYLHFTCTLSLIATSYPELVGWLLEFYAMAKSVVNLCQCALSVTLWYCPSGRPGCQHHDLISHTVSLFWH